MSNIELRIDGEVIVLTSQQTEQLKRAIKKETSVPIPRHCGNLQISHKPCGTESNYPLVISSVVAVNPMWGCGKGSNGYDLGLADVKLLIRILKEEASKIWTIAAKELKNV